MRRILTLLTLWTIIALLAAGCAAGTGDDPAGAADDASPPPPTDGTRPTVAGEWVLTEGTVDGETIASRDGARITLDITAGTVSGNASCNTYNGPLTGELPDVEVGSLAVTRKACDADTMQTERTYLAALGRVDAAEAGPEGLVLSGEGVELRFAPA